MPKNQWIKNSIFFNMKNFYYLKKMNNNFFCIYRPSLERAKDIIQRLSLIIKKILYQPRKEIYKSFQQINNVLLGWGSYYFYNTNCYHSKQIDNYVFKCLRKIMVKKFRYNGLLRPKWIAYNLLGLNKTNPNEKKWQPWALKYVRNLFQVPSYVHIWYCQDSFPSNSSKNNYYISKNISKK
jgi:hypothetical protein